MFRYGSQHAMLGIENTGRETAAYSYKNSSDADVFVNEIAPSILLNK